MQLDRTMRGMNGQAPQASDALGRLLKRASLLLLVFAAACVVAGPANAADPAEFGPTVTVTATKSSLDTPTEAAYGDAVVGRLDHGKRYPTGREASLTHPSGTSTIWFELARNGRVVAHGVQSSSGSTLLDRTAGTLVARTRQAAFPSDGWEGAPTHRFLVAYRFDADAALGAMASASTKTQTGSR